jgi:hypothetical protein
VEVASSAAALAASESVTSERLEAAASALAAPP